MHPFFGFFYKFDYRLKRLTRLSILIFQVDFITVLTVLLMFTETQIKTYLNEWVGDFGHGLFVWC